MNSERILFLIEQYGYARREGTHQGKRSAEYMTMIEDALALQEVVAEMREALEGLLRHYHNKPRPCRNCVHPWEMHTSYRTCDGNPSWSSDHKPCKCEDYIALAEDGPVQRARAVLAKFDTLAKLDAQDAEEMA